MGVSLISTGKEGHDTPSGHYRIQAKDLHHESSLYGVYKDKTTNMTTNDNADIRDPIPPNNYFVHAPSPISCKSCLASACIPAIFRVFRIARLHPDARLHGEKVFCQRAGWHPG